MAVTATTLGTWIYSEISRTIEYSGAVTLTDGTPDSITAISNISMPIYERDDNGDLVSTGEDEVINTGNYVLVKETITRWRDVCGLTEAGMIETNFVVPNASYSAEFSEVPSLSLGSVAMILDSNVLEQSEDRTWIQTQTWSSSE